MIQRIQSLYLLLTTLLSGLFLNGNILKFINKAGSEITINFKGIYKTNETKALELIEKAIPLSVIIILIPVLSIVALLLFKKRKLQLKITMITVTLEVLLIVASAFFGISVIKSYQATLVPSTTMFIPLLILIFSILAYRAIKKDEDLIKSYDRLR